MDLPADNRQFFSAVAEVIFSNPFDDARADIRALIPDAPRATGTPGNHLVRVWQKGTVRDAAQVEIKAGGVTDATIEQ